MHRPALPLLAVAAALVGLTVAPASADPGHTIGFSRNGHHWSNNLGAPLFDPAIRWVPGDVREVRFFVRNERPDAGRLRLTLMDSSRDALRETRYLRVATKVGDAPWDSATAPGRQVLADRLRVGGDDQPVQVKVRVRFLEDAPNLTMHLPTDLGFRVVLSDATAVGTAEGTPGGGIGDDGGSDAGGSPGSSPGTGGATGTAGTTGMAGTTGTTGTPGAGSGTVLSGDDRDGGLESATDAAGSGSDLPATGSMVPGWLTPAAFLLVGLGAVLLARRRPEPVDGLVDDLGEATRG